MQKSESFAICEWKPRDVYKKKEGWVRMKTISNENLSDRKLSTIFYSNEMSETRGNINLMLAVVQVTYGLICCHLQFSQ